MPERSSVRRFAEWALRVLLYRLSRWIVGFQRYFVARPRATLAGAAVLFALALVPAGKLKTLIVIDDLIDPDFRTYASMERLRNDFPNKNNLLLLVRRKEEGALPTSSALCDLLAWTNRAAERIEGIERIYSSFGVRLATDRDNSIQLTPVLRKHCGRYGTDAEEAEAVAAEMRALADSAFGPYLASRKADDVMITFYLRDEAEANRYGHFNYELYERLGEFFRSDYLALHPEMTGIWGGMGAYQYHLKVGYDQSLMLNGAAALLLFVLFRIFYGTWLSAALFGITLVFTLSIVYGMMGILGWPIDNLSNVLPTMLMVATLEDFAYMSYVRKAHGLSTSQANRKHMIPGFFTSLTTAIGFGSLWLGDLAVIRRFGVEAAVGSMVEWAAIVILVPALGKVFPRLDRWVKPETNRLERFAARISIRTPPKWVGYAALLVIPFSIASYDRLNVNDAPEEIYSTSHPFSKSVAYLKESRGWSSEVSLVFHDFAREERNRGILAKVKDDPLVGAIEDPYATRGALTSGVSDLHRGMVESVWATSPFASRLVSDRTDRARALLFLKSTDIVAVNAMRARIEPICGEDCELAGSLNSYGEFGTRVLETLFDSLGSSIVEIGAILVPLCLIRNQRRSWLLVVASMWGIFAMMAIYIVFQIKVFFITSVVASVMVGLAGDNPIQFLYSKKRRGPVSAGVEELSGASLTVTFLMSATTAVLFFSSFSFIRNLAGLVILGLFLIFVGDVFLLKCLLEPEKKRKSMV